MLRAGVAAGARCPHAQRRLFGPLRGHTLESGRWRTCELTDSHPCMRLSCRCACSHALSSSPPPPHPRAQRDTTLMAVDGTVLLPPADQLPNGTVSGPNLTAWLGCIVSPNAIMAGTVVQTLEDVASAEGCCRACRNDTGCNVFTYCNQTDGCSYTWGPRTLSLAPRQCEWLPPVQPVPQLWRGVLLSDREFQPALRPSLSAAPPHTRLYQQRRPAAVQRGRRHRLPAGGDWQGRRSALCGWGPPTPLCPTAGRL